MSVLSLLVIAAWLECFPEKPSWCRNEQVCQGVTCKELCVPTDWILSNIKMYLFTVSLLCRYCVVTMSLQ